MSFRAEPHLNKTTPRRVTRRAILQIAAGVALAAGSPAALHAAVGEPMHVVLLGDSTFDNAAYVGRGEEVAEQLRARMPAGWRATLLAVDGAVIRDVQRQLGGLPRDATHLIVSVGGNDALGSAGILQEPARSVPQALDRLAGIRDRFAADYRAMLALILAQNLPAGIATIYEPRFPEPPLRRVAAAALTILNDVITREAALRGLPVLDLRAMFDEDADYANAIEPSGRGGEKMAGAITSLVGEHDFGRARSTIFAR